MIPTLIFATNNKHKVAEIAAVIGSKINLITLQEAGITIDIPEPHATLEANATEKARTIHQLTKQHCFSEDTGLEVRALNGEPGVKSARYAGEERSFEHNTRKLLLNLAKNTDRTARFRTVISLIWHDKEYQFEGICNGQITHAEKGSGGFGYDPVFIPEGADKTFAEMTIDEKNQYSHRRKAVTQLIAFLDQQNI